MRTSTRDGLWGPRIQMLTLTVALTGVSLAVAAGAESALGEGQSVRGAVVDFRLAYNAGIAFSLGDRLPIGVVTLATAGITAAIAVYGWRIAPRLSRVRRVALALVLAGALSNVVDRSGDGTVTDYLHTGWFPTFNLADVLITVGAVTLAASFLRGDDAGSPTSSHKVTVGEPNPTSKVQS